MMLALAKTTNIELKGKSRVRALGLFYIYPFQFPNSFLEKSKGAQLSDNQGVQHLWYERYFWANIQSLGSET